MAFFPSGWSSEISSVLPSPQVIFSPFLSAWSLSLIHISEPTRR